MIIPKTVTVSELHSHYTDILNNLSEQPVVVQRWGRPVAVMLTPEAWNDIQQRLQTAERVLYERLNEREDR